MDFDRQRMYSHKHVNISLMCDFCQVYNFVTDNGTGAPPAWNWILSLSVLSLVCVDLSG